MEILILIAFGAVLLFLIGGFSLGVGSVISSALLGLSRWAEGSPRGSDTPASTYIPERPESLLDVPVEDMTRKQFNRYMRHIEQNIDHIPLDELLAIPVGKMSDAQYERYNRWLDRRIPS